MAAQMFMKVDEVMEVLGVSKPYAYKLIREMNEELKKTGCITISGRIDRKFFNEKFYSISLLGTFFSGSERRICAMNAFIFSGAFFIAAMKALV